MRQLMIMTKMMRWQLRTPRLVTDIALVVLAVTAGVTTTQVVAPLPLYPHFHSRRHPHLHHHLQPKRSFLPRRPLRRLHHLHGLLLPKLVLLRHLLPLLLTFPPSFSF